jgi:hypothetical protein
MLIFSFTIVNLLIFFKKHKDNSAKYSNFCNQFALLGTSFIYSVVDKGQISCAPRHLLYTPLVHFINAIERDIN